MVPVFQVRRPLVLSGQPKLAPLAPQHPSVFVGDQTDVGGFSSCIHGTPQPQHPLVQHVSVSIGDQTQADGQLIRISSGEPFRQPPGPRSISVSIGDQTNYDGFASFIAAGPPSNALLQQTPPQISVLGDQTHTDGFVGRIDHGIPQPLPIRSTPGMVFVGDQTYFDGPVGFLSVTRTTLTPPPGTSLGSRRRFLRAPVTNSLYARETAANLVPNGQLQANRPSTYLRAPATAPDQLSRIPDSC